jgi:hypothetical protein
MQTRISFFRAACLLAIQLGFVSMVLAIPAFLVAQDDLDPEERSKKQRAIDRDMMAKEVEQLSNQLDDDKKLVRDNAETKLLRIGPSAIEFLPAINETASDEYRMRLDRLRKEFQAMEIDEITKASTVTLTGNMTGREALMALTNQTHNKISFADVQNLDRSVDTEFDETPFWEAFDEVLDQLDLTIPGGDGNAIVLVPRAAQAPLRIASASYSGVFRVEPLTIQKNLLLHDPTNSSIQLQLLLSWEPRMTPVFVQFPMDSMKLVCDDGQVLEPRIGLQETDFVPTGGSQMMVNLEFKLPTREAKKISKWTGNVFVSTPSKPATLEFAELMKPGTGKGGSKSASVGNLTVVFEKARKNRDIYEVLLGVQLKTAGKSAESFRGWSNSNEAFLLNENGVRIEHAGWSTTRMTENEIGLSYLFDVEKGLEGHKFMYRAPASLVDQTFTFVLEDVTLP